MEWLNGLTHYYSMYFFTNRTVFVKKYISTGYTIDYLDCSDYYHYRAKMAQPNKYNKYIYKYLI